MTTSAQRIHSQSKDLIKLPDLKQFLQLEIDLNDMQIMDIVEICDDLLNSGGSSSGVDENTVCVFSLFFLSSSIILEPFLAVKLTGILINLKGFKVNLS